MTTTFLVLILGIGLLTALLQTDWREMRRRPRLWLRAGGVMALLLVCSATLSAASDGGPGPDAGASVGTAHGDMSPEQAPAPSGGAVEQALDAVQHGNWFLAASLVVIVLCALARRYLPESWEFWRTDHGGVLLVLATSFLGALAHAGAAGTSPLSLALVVGAAKVALGAIGGYTGLRKLRGLWSREVLS